MYYPYRRSEIGQDVQLSFGVSHATCKNRCPLAAELKGVRHTSVGFQARRPTQLSESVRLQFRPSRTARRNRMAFCCRRGRDGLRMGG